MTQFSSSNEEPLANVVIDMNVDALLESFSNLREDLFARLPFAYLDMNSELLGSSHRGFRVTQLSLLPLSLHNSSLIIHNDHLHLVIHHLFVLFKGSAHVQSAPGEKNVHFSIPVLFDGVLGPLQLTTFGGLPYIHPDFKCNLRRREQRREEQRQAESASSASLSPPSAVVEIAAKWAGRQLARHLRVDALSCDALAAALDEIIRARLHALRLKSTLPTGETLSYSVLWCGVVRPPPLSSSDVAVDVSSDVDGGSPRPLLRIRLRSRRHRIHLLLPQKDPLPRMVRRLPRSRLRHHQRDLLRLQTRPLHRLRSRFDAVFYVHESVVAEAADSLCQEHFLDRNFSVPRGDYNLTLSVTCFDSPRVSFDVLPQTWNMELYLPLLYTFFNGSATEERKVVKKMTLALLHRRNMELTFRLQTASTQPDELARFVFANQVFRHLHEILETRLSLQLPFVEDISAEETFVEAERDMLIFAVKIARPTLPSS